MNIEMINWLEQPREGDYNVGVKRTRGDEPIEAVIHICMETTPGISLCSYLYLKLGKATCFSFYLLLYLLLLHNRRTGGRNRFYRGEGGDTHVCKCKNETC
jgi:hypothetical protein